MHLRRGSTAWNSAQRILRALGAGFATLHEAPLGFSDLGYILTTDDLKS